MLPVLTAQLVRTAEAYTLQRQGITSSQLMERAAVRCVHWLTSNEDSWGLGERIEYLVLCGPGNNGGDGLAIARLLAGCGRTVSVVQPEAANCTGDNEVNARRLPASVPRVPVDAVNEVLRKGEILVVDALFGAGLVRPLDGHWVALVEEVNSANCPVVSIDAPSGINVDGLIWPGSSAVEADVTIGLGCFKPAYLFREFEPFVGRLEMLPIGLDFDSHFNVNDALYICEEQDVVEIIPAYRQYAHKGDHGHAAIVAGGPGMLGAAVLATRAALRSGTGLVTAVVPEDGLRVLHVAAPEAVVQVQGDGMHVAFSAMGIGPGLGTDRGGYLRSLLSGHHGTLVLDADALNTMATERGLLQLLRPGTILTPHPKEFDRLFGPHGSSMERVQRAAREAMERSLVIVLKGAHTAVCAPNGTVHFNPTGDPGMAKGGSGDVLTGLLTGLLARGMVPFEAARTGVWLHGLAGTLAAQKIGRDGMTATDIVECLPEAWRELREIPSE
ncbi:MAG: NAD(P)H-hydrate dehydratase [Flavobacteriales bacterium]|nr:MAG: NAD(P)H-hydrate dehydratase [Flavobacteriales bacterium]